MPCIKCEEGKYKWTESGECKYTSLEDCESDNSTYNAETYNDYPQSATNNAKKAIKYKKDNGSDCGTAVGWTRAGQLSRKENISRDTIARMASFKRHQQHKDVPYDEGCGGLMWDAWGGTSGVEWAIKKLDSIDKKNLSNMNWYNIKNLSNSSTEVVIYDEIGTWGVDSKSFIEEIKQISTENVLLRINSPGGSVIDGLSIHDAIKRMPQNVTAQVEGLAASIASIIALGADKITMSQNSLFMIHNVWGGETGGSKDMRKAADLMDKMGDRLVNIYVGKTGKDESEIRNWMDEETWFTADEALEAGFIDSIEKPIALAAKFDVNKLNYKNTSLVVDMFNSNKNNNNMENQIEELKNFISELFNKKVEAKEVKILDNEEVVNKISALEDSISESAKNVSDLTDTLGEKESNIIALTDEVKALEEKLAKYDGTPSEIVPEKDPNPVMENKVVNQWDNLCGSLFKS